MSIKLKWPSLSACQSKKNFLIVFLCAGHSFTSMAQADSVHHHKWVLDFGGSIGVFVPFEKEQNKIQIGSTAMTFLQLNFRKSYFARFQFGQTTVDYESKYQFPNGTASINSKANSTILGINLGYQYTWKRWNPYVMLGSHIAFIDVPTINTDLNDNNLSFSTATNPFLYLNAGAGINYNVSKSFIFMLESQISTIPNIPSNATTHLSGITFQIGIKSPL